LESIEKTNKIAGVDIVEKMTPESFSNLLLNIYNFNNGKIPYIERMYAWFPDFLQKLYDLQYVLFQDEGPVVYEWRYFLPILVLGNKNIII